MLCSGLYQKRLELSSLRAAECVGQPQAAAGNHHQMSGAGLPCYAEEALDSESEGEGAGMYDSFFDRRAQRDADGSTGAEDLGEEDEDFDEDEVSLSCPGHRRSAAW